MRLEPVAEGASQHTGCCARRSALHAEVLAIEEICGVSPIKRKGLESGKGPKGSRRPLPTVAHETGDAESTVAFGICIYRLGIPIGQIEISQARSWIAIPPRIWPLGTVLSAVRGSVPFRLAWKFRVGPAGIGFCFCLADIHGCVERQRDILEHATVEPILPRS